MPVLILTGPTAAGKSTVAPLVARMRSRCAIIDVDIVRWMYYQPHAAPWDGPEGIAQQRLGIVNASMLANNFLAEGVDVLVLDVMTNETVLIYRELLPAARVILLMPSLEETRRRFRQRPATITESQFDLVYGWQERLTEYDARLDTTILSPEETAEEIVRMWKSHPSLLAEPEPPRRTREFR